MLHIIINQYRSKSKLEDHEHDYKHVIIEFKDLKTKIKALKNAYKLKNFNKYQIYINNDLTASERAIAKELRSKRNKLNEELKESDIYGKFGTTTDGKRFHYGIRNGQIVQIAKPVSK